MKARWQLYAKDTARNAMNRRIKGMNCVFIIFFGAIPRGSSMRRTPRGVMFRGSLFARPFARLPAYSVFLPPVVTSAYRRRTATFQNPAVPVYYYRFGESKDRQ